MSPSFISGARVARGSCPNNVAARTTSEPKSDDRRRIVTLHTNVFGPTDGVSAIPLSPCAPRPNVRHRHCNWNRTKTHAHFRKHKRLAVSETQILRLLAHRIRALRLAKGWTQEQFAERAAMQRSYLADLELGRRNPSVRTLVKLANAFGIAVPDLFKPDAPRQR
jgi:DNA-binding XRE family transcriptional regulator